MLYELFKKVIELPLTSPVNDFVSDFLINSASLVTSVRENVALAFSNISHVNASQGPYTISAKSLEDGTINASLKSCDPVNIKCLDFDDLQSFQTPCGNFTAQCGPQVVETFFDPFKYFPRESFSMPSFSMPSFSMPSFLMPSFSMPSFSMPSFSMPSFSMPSFSMPWSWSNEPERIACDWNDVSCLYNEVNQCASTENSLGWTSCLLNSFKQYQQDHDLSNQQIAIAAGLVGVGAITTIAAAYTAFKLCRRRK